MAAGSAGMREYGFFVLVGLLLGFALAACYALGPWLTGPAHVGFPTLLR